MMPMTHMNLIGTDEVSRLLGVGRATVHRWAESGRLHQVGEVGKRGTRVFDRAEVEALASEEAKV